MGKKLTDVLEESGLAMNYEVGGTAPTEVMDREVAKEPCPRAGKLRELYYNTLSSATSEFAYWYTRYYKQLDGELAITRRAVALKEAFKRLTPTIFPGELIVMNRTHYYRGSYPMPWLSEGYYMAKEDELNKAAMATGGASADELSKYGTGGGNVTRSFGSVVSLAGKFGMRQEEVPATLRIAREWVNKSVDDICHRYEKMVPEYPIKESIMRNVVCVMDSGYTLPQGREVMNYYYPLQYGFDGIIAICEKRMKEVAGRAGGDGIIGTNRLYNYNAIKLVAEGVQAWILNYAKEARRLEEFETDLEQKNEYKEIAERLEWIAHNPPRNFREAIQICWTSQLAVLNEDVASGMSPGRMGQILNPYFEQDKEAGHITDEQVLEWLELQRVKFTCVDVFGSAGVVGGVLSGNTFHNVCVGGLLKNGLSAANDLEKLFLEAGIRCVTPQPTLSVMYDEKTPEDFLLKAIECNKTGTGYPAWINNRVAMDFILRQYGREGMTVDEARAWSVGGCLETSPGSWFDLTLNGKTYTIPGGTGQPTCVGVHFIGLPKVLELVLFDGVDQRTGDRVFPAHGKKLETYEELWAQYQEYFRVACDCLATTNNIEHDIWRKHNMAIATSMMKADWIETGHLIHEMGYRYNGTYNVESCGTANYVNSMIALKKLVYDDRSVTLEEMKAALKQNFGFKTAEEVGSYSLSDQEKRDDRGTYDRVHFQVLSAPKYGNDDPYADEVFRQWQEWFNTMCSDYESLYGLPMYPCQISVSSHAPMGAATIATPDGRLSGTTFADGSMSAYAGTDRNGPYALFNSATCWDHSQSQNSQMNMKVHPSAVHGIEGSKKLLDLTRSYMRKGGFHIQYNIVDSKVLRAAQADQDKYRDLVVRVAGFTQYWCEIGKPIQDEVVARTEYEGM
jgi:4-hydroxyphenylacetate decarboxylase large subunit